MNRTTYAKTTIVSVAACLVLLSVPAPASAWKEFHDVQLPDILGEPGDNCADFCADCFYKAQTYCTIVLTYSCGASGSGCSCSYSGIC